MPSDDLNLTMPEEIASLNRKTQIASEQCDQAVTARAAGYCFCADEVRHAEMALCAEGVQCAVHRRAHDEARQCTVQRGAHDEACQVIVMRTSVHGVPIHTRVRTMQ